MVERRKVRNDLTGKKFGILTVVARGNSRITPSGQSRTYWIATCECGSPPKEYQAGDLKKIKSCGCKSNSLKTGRPGKDYTGQKFGNLEVLEIFNSQPGKARRCLCRCDCRVVKEFVLKEITSGKTVSCGCVRREKSRQRDYARKPEGAAQFNRILSSYKRNAATRGFAWELTARFCFNLFTMPCHYCGIVGRSVAKWSPAVQVKEEWRILSAINYNGIDRVNNDKGYCEDNVVPCCSVCNEAKGKLSLADFGAQIDKIFLHICQGK
jgi:hypothetical protein